MNLDEWPQHIGEEEFVLPVPETLVGACIATLSQDSSRPLFYDASGSITRKEFLERTSHLAAWLKTLGLCKGDRILISGSTTIDLAVAHMAALRFGLIVVPVNGLYQKNELEHVVNDASPKAALIDHGEWGKWINSINPKIFVSDTSAKFSDGLVPELDQVKPEDPALIVYTSGTTGRPKGAVLSQRNLLAGAHSVRLAWKWTEEDRLYLCLPLFHMHGMGVGLHGTLLSGSSAILEEGFRAEEVLNAIESKQVSMFFGVPTMYHRLIEHPQIQKMKKMRLCVSGSAPLPASLHRQFNKDVGIQVLERYGMTETVMLVSNPYEGERRPGTVGFSLPGVRLKLEEGSGEILVNGPNVFEGYWNRPDADSESFSSDSVSRWFRTGDLGELDEDGYLKIVGRKKELIISGGYNVYPREVDDVLITHPDIEEVAVAGVPSKEWGEEVVAWIVPSPNQEAPSLEEIRDFGRQYLAAYKLPKRVVVTDVLPRNALGKVLRQELREK